LTDIEQTLFKINTVLPHSTYSLEMLVVELLLYPCYKPAIYDLNNFLIKKVQKKAPPPPRYCIPSACCANSLSVWKDIYLQP